MLPSDVVEDAIQLRTRCPVAALWIIIQPPLHVVELGWEHNIVLCHKGQNGWAGSVFCVVISMLQTCPTFQRPIRMALIQQVLNCQYRHVKLNSRCCNCAEIVKNWLCSLLSLQYNMEISGTYLTVTVFLFFLIKSTNNWLFLANSNGYLVEKASSKVCHRFSPAICWLVLLIADSIDHGPALLHP